MKTLEEILPSSKVERSSYDFWQASTRSTVTNRYFALCINSLVVLTMIDTTMLVSRGFPQNNEGSA